MATDWNFSYSKMISPILFNIRPSYTAINLSISSGTNKIIGASNYLLTRLVVGMKIETENEEFGTREIIAIDVLNKIIYFSGNVLSTYYEGNFTFYSNPGYFSEQATPLNGQQIHDNFYYLAEGLTNHQERITALEQQKSIAGDANVGFVEYNSYERKEGAFYTGNELSYTATTQFDTGAIFAGSYLDIAIDKGVNNTDLLSSNFWRISATHITPFATPNSFVTYMNQLLKNNNNSLGFSVVSGAFSSSYNPPFDGDWDTIDKAAFFINFDDNDEQDAIKITFSQSDKLAMTNWNATANILNAKFIALGISQKVSAREQDIGTGDLRLVIEGNNDRVHGCSRITFQNVLGSSFLEDVLRLQSTSCFDFTTYLQFGNNNNYITLTGLNKSFKIVLKEGDSPANLLSKAGFSPSFCSGTSTLYHSEAPKNNNRKLNFDGIIKSTTLQSNVMQSDEAHINNLATIDSLQVTDIQTENINVQDTIQASDAIVNNSLQAVTEIITSKSTIENLDVNNEAHLKGPCYIENGDNTEYRVLYRKQILDTSNPQALITANAPKKDTSDVTAFCINDDIAAVNGDFTGNVRIHGTTKANGRLYAGSTVPSNNTVILNFDGIFKATSVLSTSSREFKENIKDFEGKALDILKNVKIVNYNFIGDTNKKVGFIAEETDSLLSGPSKNSIDYSNTIGLLIKAIQELYEIIQNIPK